MRPHEAIDAALERSVGEHVAKLKKRVRRARDGEPEDVHDARTALRRVREDLVVMGQTVFDRGRAAKLEDRLHELEKALSKPRDADILLGLVRAHLKRLPADRAGLAELVARLEKRRERSARAAREVLDAEGRAAVRDVRKLLSRACSPGGGGDPSKAAPRLVHHFTREAIYRAYDAVLAYDTKDAPDADTLHGFRSACRRLRYAIELFEGALDGSASASTVAELRGAQDDIGQMHDHHVAATLVETWVRDGKLRATPELERFVEAEERERDGMRQAGLRRFEAILGLGFRASLASAMDGALRARAA